MSSYIPNTKAEQADMLKTLELDGFEGLFSRLPDDIRLKRSLDLPDPLSELETADEMRRLADMNEIRMPSFLGAGCYNHFIPAVVGHMTSRSEFYTAYTPYQPEASQGALQAIFEYQTMICELTGMDASNASLYDGATAAAEAAAMCVDITRRCNIAVAGNAHPDIIEVMMTYCRSASVELIILPYNASGVLDESSLASVCGEIAGLIVQHPNYFGCLEDMESAAKAAHDCGALFVASVNPLSLGLLTPPGEYGADIAVGDGQPLGNPPNFGGPGFGFITTHEKHQRKLPGRIAGLTSDPDGARAFVLTLQAREQHIRREKASSNICSNQALNALAASVYLAALGPSGLAQVAGLCTQKAHYARERICSIKGMRLAFDSPFFHEFVIDSEIDGRIINHRLLESGIIGGLDLGGGKILYCVTEMNSKDEIDKLVSALEGIL